MTLNLVDLLLVLLIGVGSLYAFNGVRVRELALAAARRGCEAQGVQLLDGSVSVKKVSLSRDKGGRWRVWRQFSFDYSIDGVERRRGHVIMLGYVCEGVVISEPTLH